MAWCRVPDCKNLSLAGDLCPKHKEQQVIRSSHERKENGMKVKVSDGYQLVDSDGKVVTSGGTADLPSDEAKAAINNGWATEAKAAPKPAAQKTTKKK